jgi:DnaJ-class molecular chaperone
MKVDLRRIEQQNYYEILEVSPRATAKEIQKAYEHAKETFQQDSLAVYSLFNEQEIKKIQTTIEEAYRVLMDEELRKRYDESHLSDLVDGQREEGFSESQGDSDDMKSRLSFIDISVDAGIEVYRGKALKQIRERMGIELKAVSLETKISVKILEHIEEEALNYLPPMVYLKSFLKGYARSLGLDPQRVVEEYLSLLPVPKKK